jgi:hypothetical protein
LKPKWEQAAADLKKIAPHVVLGIIEMTGANNEFAINKLGADMVPKIMWFKDGV